MYCAYITEVQKIRPHSNADRLQCIEVFGNTVVVDLSYYEGQKVIYFPTDGQLGEEFAKENNLLRIKNEDGTYSGGYIDANKRNIKAIRLRGEKSDGLVLPIESLKEFTDVKGLKVGDQITTLNGKIICKKYIPQSKQNKRTPQVNNKTKKRINKVEYPFFAEHSDTKQLAYNLNSFKRGDTIYITLKTHGTSGRSSRALQVKKRRPTILHKIMRRKPKIKRDWKVVSGTRRTILKNYDGGYYGNDNFRKLYHDFFAEHLPKGMEVFYEIVGWVNDSTPIMATCKNSKVKDKKFSKKYGDTTIFDYGCEQGQSKCFVYRMTFTNEDGYTIELPWEQVQIECEKMGVPCVPTFDKFIFTTSEDLVERVKKYEDGEDPIGKTHIREGVVVRIDNREQFTAYKHKNFHFKVLESIIKDESDEPDMEEMEDTIDCEQ